MNQVRYETLLKERIQKTGYVKFANSKTFHARLLEYLNEQIKTGLEKDAFRDKDNHFFKISVSFHEIFVRTIHKHVEIIKCFRATPSDNISESLELLRQKIAIYGLGIVSSHNYESLAHASQPQDFSVIVLTNEELKN